MASLCQLCRPRPAYGVLALAGYRADPIAEKHGFTFDRTPAGELCAPDGLFRVYAYHVDFDHAPASYCDRATLTEAKHVCDTLPKHSGGFNVDYGVVYDSSGKCVHNGCPW